MVGTLLSSGNTHPEVEESTLLHRLLPPFRVLIPLVPSINDAVALLQVCCERCDGLVNRSAGLDKHDDDTWLLNGVDEGCRVMETVERKVSF